MQNPKYCHASPGESHYRKLAVPGLHVSDLQRGTGGSVELNSWDGRIARRPVPLEIRFHLGQDVLAAADSVGP
jgi:hypothetical protein